MSTYSRKFLFAVTMVIMNYENKEFPARRKFIVPKIIIYPLDKISNKKKKRNPLSRPNIYLVKIKCEKIFVRNFYAN